MKSTNAADRVARNRIYDQFCSPERGMVYDPVNHMDQMDAVLWSEKKPFEKLFGVSRLVKQPGNFGNQPVVAVEKEKVDFVNELAILCGVKAAIVFKFRDGKLMYWRVEELDKVPFETNMKRGKACVTYQIPIQNLRQV